MLEQKLESVRENVFLALVLESALQRKLIEKEIKVEYMYLLRDLQQLKAVELTLADEQYLCRTEMVGCAYEALKALGIRPPLKVTELKNAPHKSPEYCIPPLF